MGLEPFRRGSPESLDAYLKRMMRLSLAPNRCMLFSAHQMGTCRMGDRRSTSVTDVHCESHDVKGLFVPDASAFPTASGTNPMITIMAIAHKAAQYIKTQC
jgi:choline dehydrogenase-like flavoprotein